jgi:Sulfite exporter TauE/SafE
MELLFFVLAGFLAQLIDGTLGMAYGVTFTSLLLTVGYPPAAARASVHMAEIVTSGVSGHFHWRLGNVDPALFRNLVSPGRSLHWRRGRRIARSENGAAHQSRTSNDSCRHCDRVAEPVNAGDDLLRMTVPRDVVPQQNIRRAGEVAKLFVEQGMLGAVRS